MVESGRKLSKAEADLHHASIRYQLWGQIAAWVGRILMVMSFAVPLVPVYLSVHALAGEETIFKIEAVVAFSLLVGGGGAISSLASWWKWRSQRNELKRLRKRVEELEGESEAAATS